MPKIIMVPVLRLVIFTMNVGIFTWDRIPESNKKQMAGKEYKPWTVRKQYFFRILSNLQQFTAQGLPKPIMVYIYAVYKYVVDFPSWTCVYENSTYSQFSTARNFVHTPCMKNYLFWFLLNVPIIGYSCIREETKQVIQPFLSGART